MNISDANQKVLDLLSQLTGQVAFYTKFLNDKNEIKLNENTEMWAASVIKIPIACEFFRQVSNKELKEDTLIKISPENNVEGTGVLKLLDKNDEFTYLDLVTLMIAVSDNSATNQLVDIIGSEKVEVYMRELGLQKTTFRHKMFIKAGKGPNLTTVLEISILLEKILNNEISGAEKLLNILKKQQDRTRIPLLLPNNIEVAHKTGSLPEAMHDVGIVYAKQPFIFSFMSDDQTDKRKTNAVLSECAKICFDYANQ